MPFGMGPAGWFMVPYVYPYWLNFFRYWGYNPWYSGYDWAYGYQFPDELAYLRQIKQDLEVQLQDINARIEALEKSK